MKKETRIQKIQSYFNHKRYAFKDFEDAAPFSISLLKRKDRRHHIVGWKYVGIIWARLSGLKQEDVAEIFEVSHCTVNHAEKSMLAHLQGFTCYYYLEPLKKVQAKSEAFVEPYDERLHNIIETQIMLENKLHRRLNNMTRVDLYPAFVGKASSAVVNDNKVLV